jgi:hypothetical protein
VRPGYYAPTDYSERQREEVILAIAQHDNGWWEWEASPSIDPADGLPYGLTDENRETARDTLDRWHAAASRLADRHLYAALLISMHPTWLYRFAFADLVEDHDEPFRHPLFGTADAAKTLVADPILTRALIAKEEARQAQLISRLRRDPAWRDAADPLQLNPHVRLLQLMDALSLLLCMGSDASMNLPHIPRGGWDDRVTLAWQPQEGQRIICSPYPFVVDPLRVFVPVRMVEDPAGAKGVAPLVRLHAAPLQTVRFEVVAG